MRACRSAWSRRASAAMARALAARVSCTPRRAPPRRKADPAVSSRAASSVASAAGPAPPAATRELAAMAAKVSASPASERGKGAWRPAANAATRKGAMA